MVIFNLSLLILLIHTSVFYSLFLEKAETIEKYALLSAFFLFKKHNIILLYD